MRQLKINDVTLFLAKQPILHIGHGFLCGFGVSDMFPYRTVEAKYFFWFFHVFSGFFLKIRKSVINWVKPFIYKYFNYIFS